MFSDVHAAFKKWPNPGKMGLFMAPNEIKNSVLKSCSVQDVIFEVAKTFCYTLNVCYIMCYVTHKLL